MQRKVLLELLEPGKVRSRPELRQDHSQGKEAAAQSLRRSNKLDEEVQSSDSLVLSIPEKNIEDRIEFKVGNLAMVVGGKHAGQTERYKEIITGSAPT
jgi:small subunit ribosomal protein S4e